MKQCPNCRTNLADYVPTCPHCGVNVSVTPTGLPQPAWSGPQEKSGKATASLVCGILLCLSPFSSAAAVVLGHLALSEIKKSAGRMAGHGVAVAGLVLGYVGLVVFVPITLIIAAIAIPNLLRARMAANEASAVGTLRTYNTAMVAYASQCPRIGYPKELGNLGPGPSGGDPCAHADLVSGQMAAQVPLKSGYRFYYTPRANFIGPSASYVLSADPVAPGTSGVRHFFTDQSGVIRMSTGDGADVNSEPLQ